jgi:type II secretory pathway predicted ATPase ExeA
MSTHNLLSKEVLTEICAQFKQLRVEHQLSIEELQAATNLNLKVLKRMENGKCMPFRYYRRLLEFYGKKVRIVIE